MSRITELRREYKTGIVEHEGRQLKQLPSWRQIAIPLKIVSDLAKALEADLPCDPCLDIDPILSWVRNVAEHSSSAYQQGINVWSVDEIVHRHVEQLLSFEKINEFMHKPVAAKSSNREAAVQTLVNILRPRFDELSRKYCETPVSVTLVHYSGQLSAENALAFCPHKAMPKPTTVRPGPVLWIPTVGAYGPVHRDPKQNEFRLYFFKTSNPTACSAFNAIAEEAAHCVADWATELGVAPETIDTHSAIGRWIYTLFDLAWTNYPRFPIDTKRNFLQNIEIHHQGVRLQCDVEKPDESISDKIAALQHEGYYAQIKDVLRASLYAIDVLSDRLVDESDEVCSDSLPTPIPSIESIPLNELESTTPPVDRTNGKWVPSSRAAKIDGVEPATLRRYRHAGIKNQEKTLGRDHDGRIWRRDGTDHSHPWYLRSSLKRDNL